MSRAALYDSNGGPEVLHLEEVPDPIPGDGEVVVHVRAAGLNPIDSKLRSGLAPGDAPFPRRVGSDLAGTVAATGPGAVYWDGSTVRVGDEVLGRAPGSVAEFVVARASELVRRPAGVPVEEAGGLWIAALTALSCQVTVPVGSDDTVLVGGAGGAVGIMAAQLAVASGARVIGTASPRNHELLRGLGIEPVTYGVGLADHVAGLGHVTAVMDCHGRDALDAGLQLGVPADRMVAIAAYSALAEIGARNVERTARTAANLARIVEEVAAGRLVLPVAATFPLNDVQGAFEALDAPHPAGKIVVVP